MKVTLHSPVEGKAPGDTVDVPDARGEWLVANGYAVFEGGNPENYGNTSTTVTAEKDPTRAENREAPGEEPPKPNEPKRQAKKASVKKDEADDKEQPTEG